MLTRDVRLRLLVDHLDRISFHLIIDYSEFFKTGVLFFFTYSTVCSRMLMMLV